MRLARFGYPALVRLAGSQRGRAVGPRTTLLVEGFPRSANSIVSLSLAELNPDARIAHHLHAVAQFNAAERRGVPALLVVRDPVDAVASIRAGWPFWSPGATEADDLAYWSEFHLRIARWAPSSVPVRASSIEADLARASRRPGFAHLDLGVTAEVIDRAVERLEQIEDAARGPDDLDRSSSPKRRSQARLAAAEALVDRVGAPVVEQAREIYRALEQAVDAADPPLRGIR